MGKELCVFIPSPRKTKGGRPAPFWGTNEIIDAARKGRFAYRSQKDKAEKHIARIVAEAMEEQGWTCPDGPVEEWLTFVEPHNGRDEGNVYGGEKYVTDAICTPDLERKVPRHKHSCGAIWDDNRKCIKRIHLAIAGEVDRDRPGVWLRLVKVEEEA